MAVAVTAFFASARHFSASARKYSARVCIGSKCKSGHSRIQIRINPSELGRHHTPGTGRKARGQGDLRARFEEVVSDLPSRVRVSP
jgi:hypothetical protein